MKSGVNVFTSSGITTNNLKKLLISDFHVHINVYTLTFKNSNLSYCIAISSELILTSILCMQGY